MNRVLLFYGSKEAFEKELPITYRTLTDVVYEFDKDSKNVQLILPGQENVKQEQSDVKIDINDFVISSDEYAGVREHVIMNFVNFLSKFNVSNLYIHNPPVQISEQLRRLCPEIEIKKQKYKHITKTTLKYINNHFGEHIIGQERVKNELIQALYPLTFSSRKKPIVILFCGRSGLGKTETAKFLANTLKEHIFRKQFSMFQNNQFATYLFGGAHYEKSFAKDLLDRDSNIILLDEFDKAHTSFHSAFYQIFDEGIYEDQNYSMSLEKAVVICTSNYLTVEEVEEKLGSALYNRFDKIICFDELNSEAKVKIGNDSYEKNKKIYGFDLDEEVKNRLFQSMKLCCNAREIHRLVTDTFSYVAIAE